MKKSLLALLLVLICIGSFFAYKSHEKDIKQGYVFGTYYKITTLGENKYMPEIEAVFAEVNAKMSVFQADSEINKVNSLKANQEIEISPELLFVLQNAKDIYHQSNGSFDPTLGTLIDLWGFGLKGKEQELSQAQIEEALLDVGMDKVILGKNTLIKTRDATSINLSAIAKGYAIDRVAQVLIENGCENFLIDIGGEVYARGKADIWGKAWNVAIQNPSDKNSALMSFELDNLAIATSGDYEKFIEKDGERYSHTLDPQTGKPIKNKLASVTVLHKSTMLADAYATALMAMGEEKAISFAQEHSLRAIFLIREGEKLILLQTN